MYTCVYVCICMYMCVCVYVCIYHRRADFAIQECADVNTVKSRL